MDPKDFSMYDSAQVRVVPFPEAEACGDGWWRVAWRVEVTPCELPRDLHLPPPSRDLGDLTLVVAVLPREPGQITVEVLSRHEKLIGEEVAYISLVMQKIRALCQEITVDGYENHPILRMAKT